MHLQAPKLPASYFVKTRGIEGLRRPIHVLLNHRALKHHEGVQSGEITGDIPSVFTSTGGRSSGFTNMRIVPIILVADQNRLLTCTGKGSYLGPTRLQSCQPSLTRTTPSFQLCNTGFASLIFTRVMLHSSVDGILTEHLCSNSERSGGCWRCLCAGTTSRLSPSLGSSR